MKTKSKIPCTNLVAAASDEVHREVYALGGVTIITQFIDNGDAMHGLPGAVFMNQTLICYGNSNLTRIEFGDAVFTVENLRELANQLECGLNQANIKAYIGAPAIKNNA